MAVDTFYDDDDDVTAHLERVRSLEDEVCILKGVIADMAIERHHSARVRSVD